MNAFLSWLSNLFANHKQYGKAPEEGRSPHWPTFRKHFLETHPSCEATGTDIDLELHHIVPFSKDPSLELSPTNIIVLTHPIHFFLGHWGDWHCFNPNIREDAAALLKKIQNRHRLVGEMFDVF